MIEAIHRPSLACVNLAHIRYNLNQVMAHLPDCTQAWAVVKANAYGHGSVEVARYLEEAVTGFCLSNMDEAMELRQAGIQAPLLVMGIVPVEAVSIAIEHDIRLTIASEEWFEALLQKEESVEGLKVHLKLDTGMGRIGFRQLSSLKRVVEALPNKGIVFDGIFTHFATADERDDQQFQAQLALFKEMLSALPEQPRMVHASNSATAIWHGETVFDAVRLGDVLYGLNPSGHALGVPYEVKPALTLTSELVHVKEVEAGTSIGYGATYHSDRREWIGTLPIGYADGVTRDLQGYHVLVDGQKCEMVGRVSMDQITIRLPKAYPLGTLVTLIGADGDEVVTVQDWADYRQTINYEVVCLLTDRLPRVYKP